MPPPTILPPPPKDLSARLAALEAALQGKASATAVSAMATAVQTSLTAIESTIPRPSRIAPMGEATDPSPGTNDTSFSMEGHQHPRLTSTTTHTTNAAGQAAVTFTRSFARKLGLAITTDSAGKLATPDASNWTTDQNGRFTGCTITLRRQKIERTELRATVLTISVVTGIMLNVTEEPVPSVAFSCVAVARSDPVT